MPKKTPSLSKPAGKGPRRPHPIHRLLAIMARLRHPTRGCPWDLEQDHKKLKVYLVEESHEVLDAIDSGSDAKLADELGDLLLQIVFHAQMASERRAFDFATVASGISEKLVRRHPHIFAGRKVRDSAEVLRNWEEIKKSEKGRESVFDGVPRHLPALLRAFRLQEKASVVGFDWKAAHEVAEKVREEIEEFLAVSRSNERERMEEEYGDILFSLVNLGRFLGLNAEFSLEAANRKFMERFGAIEEEARRRGVRLESMTLEEMDRIWEETKGKCFEESPP
ncbi:MAG: nucleoside triphosphate pyrophosphohydrolase [Candidatus Riflebacteria bacterium]|nr:nucleoside triphosphate pyrophosphohydrolase [Candidatus Riflebacteria bacterium]